MKIAICSDHRGYGLKTELVGKMVENGISFEDYGCFSEERCDYPVFAKKVAGMVASGEVERGILICGTGIGMSIVANKFKGVRAALCSDLFSAKATREHNDSNILCMGERVLDEELMSFKTVGDVVTYIKNKK